MLIIINSYIARVETRFIHSGKKPLYNFVSFTWNSTGFHNTIPQKLNQTTVSFFKYPMKPTIDFWGQSRPNISSLREAVWLLTKKIQNSTVTLSRSCVSLRRFWITISRLGPIRRPASCMNCLIRNIQSLSPTSTIHPLTSWSCTQLLSTVSGDYVCNPLEELRNRYAEIIWEEISSSACSPEILTWWKSRIIFSDPQGLANLAIVDKREQLWIAQTKDNAELGSVFSKKFT